MTAVAQTDRGKLTRRICADARARGNIAVCRSGSLAQRISKDDRTRRYAFARVRSGLDVSRLVAAHAFLSCHPTPLSR